jgi:hypothetical protein
MARTCYADSGVLYPTTSRSRRASWALLLLNKVRNRSSGCFVLWDVDKRSCGGQSMSVLLTRGVAPSYLLRKAFSEDHSSGEMHQASLRATIRP